MRTDHFKHNEPDAKDKNIFEREFDRVVEERKLKLINFIRLILKENVRMFSAAVC